MTLNVILRCAFSYEDDVQGKGFVDDSLLQIFVTVLLARKKPTNAQNNRGEVSF